MTIPFVDLKKQYLEMSSLIDARMQKVMDHMQFINGPEVDESEKALADFVGCTDAIVCSNGTIALYLALMAAGVGQGDEVIVPAFSFIATAEVVHLVGATPVYVDIELKTYNLDNSQLEKALSPKTKAIMPVSLYGQTPDMDTINSFAKKNNLIVIEDGAQSFGAEYKGKKSCNLSEIGCTSFFPAKPLGVYGDGGAIFTSNKDLADKLRLIRNHGQESRYFHSVIGTNARMNTLQCAVLLAKLSRYPWEIEQRNRIARTYTEAFSELNSVKTPHIENERLSVWAQYTLSTEDRDSAREKLMAEGVPTAVHYPKPMCDHPAYEGQGRVIGRENSVRASQIVMSLPMYADMPESDVEAVIRAVKKVLA